MSRFAFGFVFLQLVNFVTAAELPRSLGVLTSNKPAFLYLLPNDSSSHPSLFVTSFQAFGRDEVRQISNVASYMNNFPQAQETVLTSSITWPNSVQAVSTQLAGHESLLLVAGGFLVPGKGTGALSLLDLRNNAVKKISKDKSGWFYHRAIWTDIDRDGRVDLLSARATKPLFGSAKGELLWFKQPASNPTTSVWAETMLKAGPDVHFDLVDLNGDGRTEIIAAEFFGKKLSLHWFEGTTLRSRTIDATIGAGFDLSFVDLNMDGRKDILLTNHESSATKAAVFAFEIPSDLVNGNFVRHTLLSNIQTRNGGQNQASPGSAFAFRPDLRLVSKKPFIAVSGDGSQRVHLLIPNSENTSDWSYRENIIVDVGGTVGQLAVGDVDGDQYSELFVPAYDGNKIYAFTYAPN